MTARLLRPPRPPIQPKPTEPKPAEPKPTEPKPKPKKTKKPSSRKSTPGRKNEYDPNSQNAKALASRTKATLNDSAKRRRERFIDRYLVHFVGKRAALEIGIKECSASKTASQFLREPYVLAYYKKRVEALSEDELVSRKDVLMGLLKEANFEGQGHQHAARVAAWAKLGRYKGMEKGEDNRAASIHLHFDQQDSNA